jgi:sugar (pentulose or hexulose) kinase
MDYYAGIDVSLEASRACVVDGAGRVVREAKVPSEPEALAGFFRQLGRRHKRLTDWVRQLVLQVRRWLPKRDLVLVNDSGFAALELLAALSHRGVVCITRLRLDTALYDPVPPRLPGTNGRPRTKGARRPNLSGVLTDAGTRWQPVTVPGRYGEGERAVELCSAAAV